MVWKWALPGPRVVRVLGRGTISEPEDLVEAVANLHIEPQDPACKIPLATPLLHACSWSRQVALKRYQLAFETLLGHPVYFDWDHDILFLHGWYALKLFTGIWDLWGADENDLSEDFQDFHANIKHIAMDVTTHWQHSFQFGNLSAFPKLSTLTWFGRPLGLGGHPRIW